MIRPLSVENPELISKQTWCLTSTETTRLIRDGGGGGGGTEVGEREIIIPVTTLSPPE